MHSVDFIPTSEVAALPSAALYQAPPRAPSERPDLIEQPLSGIDDRGGIFGGLRYLLFRDVVAETVGTCNHASAGVASALLTSHLAEAKVRGTMQDIPLGTRSS